MALAKRIFFFMLVNLGLMISISIFIFAIQAFFGISITPNISNGYGGLALYSLIFGFSSSILSLLISRMMAKWSYGVKLVSEERLMDQPAKVQKVYALVARLAKQNAITMPEVGVYDSPEPNAFATGPTKNRALVAVSSWLLDVMTDAEVEGVVGHEMAHILNGDMVTMTLLQGVINTIVIFVSRVIANIVSSAISKDSDQAMWITPVVAIVLEIVLSFAAMIVLSAFSRFREFRADEGSAKMLGKSQMIAALRKLNVLHEKLAGKVETDERLATMQISTYKISRLFSTHPPLEQRIAALEKRYDIA